MSKEVSIILSFWFKLVGYSQLYFAICMLLSLTIEKALFVHSILGLMFIVLGERLTIDDENKTGG